MARKLPSEDVVIIGLGWTGSIMAYELANAGLEVIAIERGPWRNAATDFAPNFAPDELRYRVHHELFLRPEQTTFTFRNKMSETALPIRNWGAFMPPNGVGGGGVHWNAETWRFLPTDFVLRTHLTERYGAGFLPEDMTIQDWGVTFDEIEPHYDRFEYLCGTSGQAGNIKGQMIEGGNPFEGPRSRRYPTPPQDQPFAATLFAKAARDLGYKPFPRPSRNLSRPYRNPLGLRLGPCTYCGLIETPFGNLVSPNITPDSDTGIGAWTDEQFDAAVRSGRARDGARLYPAMPFPYYARMSREDVKAVRAYLSAVEPVHNKVNPDTLPFPFNLRSSVVVWDALYFRPGEFRADPSKSKEWNQGAYLVEGPGHCGACHTPKTFLGGDKTSEAFRGYALQGWSAPDITGGPLGKWTDDDIVDYLKTGHNKYAAAAGLMGEVVQLSTSNMTDDDLKAIAVFLKDRSQVAPPTDASVDQNVMTAGAAIYKDLCAACHQHDGQGVPNLFPRLSETPTVATADPTTVLRVILKGTQTVATDGEPTGPAMPAFGWQLDDEQVAAVASCARNHFAHAPGVSADQAKKAREALAARTN